MAKKMLTLVMALSFFGMVFAGAAVAKDGGINDETGQPEQEQVGR
jgi:hypothetical protein